MTKGKRIRLDHPVLVADLPRLLEGIGGGSEVQRGPDLGSSGHVLLIGRRHLRSNNSWMHNLPRLMGGSNRATLQIHPADARANDLIDGGQVEVTSEIGSIAVQVEVTDSLMPGVVCLPHGWGHGTRPGTSWKVAAEYPGASINDITDRRRFDPLSGNAAVTAVPVRLRPLPSDESNRHGHQAAGSNS